MSFCILGFLGISADKESARNAGDLGSIPELGRSSGEGNGYLLQYSGLENSMDCIVHGVAKSRTWLSDFHFHFFHILSLYGLSKNIEYSSLCCTAGPRCLSFYIWKLASANPTLPLHACPSLPLPWQPQVCPLHLWVCFCFINSFVS